MLVESIFSSFFQNDLLPTIFGSVKLLIKMIRTVLFFVACIGSEIEESVGHAIDDGASPNEIRRRSPPMDSDPNDLVVRRLKDMNVHFAQVIDDVDSPTQVAFKNL